MTNCPNCGAPIEPYKVKCKYCGTYYFDLEAFDMSKDKPCYIKFKMPHGNTITCLAHPEMENIEFSMDSHIYCDSYNHEFKVPMSPSCDIGIIFHVYPDEDGSMMKIAKE